MRTTINLDEELIAEAQRLTGTQDRTALIHEGLRALIARESGRRVAGSAEATHARRRPEGAAFRDRRRHFAWIDHLHKTVPIPEPPQLANSDRGQSLNRIRIALDQIDQQCGLRIWSGTTLFPVLERAGVGSKVRGEQCARQFEAFA